MKKLKRLSIFFSFFTTICSAQYEKLFDFGRIAGGYYTQSTPISDGTYLYGMTTFGGISDFGTIFKIKPDGTGDTTIFNFTGIATGSHPCGSLFFDGTYLYGMTYEGGANNLGTIFKILPDGTGYLKLQDFSGSANGSYPYGALSMIGTYLYGTTSNGGTSGQGTLFRIKPDGTGDSLILNFNGVVRGSGPSGSVISDGTYLYGTTGSGGPSGNGTIFKVKPDGTSYVRLIYFSIGNPTGSLYYDGTYLYGTNSGISGGYGNVFKLKTDGTGYTDLLDFSNTNGGTPYGSLVSDGTYLYGTTSIGGPHNSGNIFKVKYDGSSNATVFNFNDTTDWSHPHGSLFFDGTHLYGMTTDGAAPHTDGNLFKIKSDGTDSLSLIDFNFISNGKNPHGGLLPLGSYLYGMTSAGGTKNNGSIFKIKSDGTDFSHILDFDSTSTAYGKAPNGSLISVGAYLYGMTSTGGTYNNGTGFKIKPDGTGYSTLHNFGAVPDGINPNGSFIFDGLYLIGMTTYGGANNTGSIFKILPDGTGYSVIYSFDLASGRNPWGSLYFDGSYLYGTTAGSSTAFNYGTIFKIKPDGTGYFQLYNFSGSGPDGRTPNGSLVSDGVFLYGTTSLGGSSNYGTVFKIKTNGTMYSKIFDFTPSSLGKEPVGSLIYDGTFLYGSSGGGMSSYGTLFKIKTDGTSYVDLIDFNDNLNGSHSLGELVSDGHFLYGMTWQGGWNAFGTIFKYDGLSSCVANYSTSYDSLTNNFTLTVNPITAAAAVGYFWDFGDGSTSNVMTPSHSYTVDTVYNVCMKIYTAAGDSCTYCDTIGKDYLGNIIRTGGFTINVQNSTVATSVPAGVSQKEIISIFPNPTSGSFTVTIGNDPSKTNYGTLSILNLMGEKLFSKESEQLNNSKIDLSNLSNGVYFLELKMENNFFTKKIVINK